MADSGFHVSARITWLGDLDGRYILELPVYNYLVIAANYLSHDLDRSGKLVSIALWAISFCVLQLIWRRCLNPQETFWANVIFVVAPLGVFYGQAFMPEMLVQLLAFTFVWLSLRYDEDVGLGRWILLASVGILALLIKLPEIAHLYFFPGFLILRREGWKALLRPRYLGAAIVTVALLKGWSAYVDSVNASYVPEWTSSQMMRTFIGPIENRLQAKAWLMIALYVGAFIVPGLMAIATVYGFSIAVIRQHRQLLLLWIISLGAFYLTWFGSGPPSQSYYNLPAVAPLSALAGIGIAAILKVRVFASRPGLASVCAVALLVLPCIPIWSYLFREDKQIIAATAWMEQNTQPDDLILFIPNHRWDMIPYRYNPVPAYYSGRSTFVFYGGLAGTTAQDAIKRAKFALVTSPKPPEEGVVSIINRLRNTAAQIPQATDWLERNGFRPIAQEPAFVAFRKG